VANPDRSSYLLSLAIVSLAVLWLVFSQLVVPPLIESIYHGESLPILNGIISGQAVHPVQHYLTQGDRIAWRILSILLLVSLIVLLNPESQRCVDARLRRYRVWIVYAAIVLITWGSLFDIVTDTEHWPFSPYRMYSDVNRDYSLTQFRLFGVTESAPLREMALWEFQYIQPFDNSRLHAALRGMLGSRTRNQWLSEALRDILVRYDALRHAGLHNGPPLRGIRLYRLYWKLDPWARNVDDPDSRELVLEVANSVGE
jgi:hypothetical protein